MATITLQGQPLAPVQAAQAEMQRRRSIPYFRICARKHRVGSKAFTLCRAHKGSS